MKFIRNILVIAAAVNLAASVYYLLAGVVPVGVFWQATVACVKAGWPGYILLCGAGASLAIPRIGSVARYSVAGGCFTAAMYFAVVSNVVFYKTIFAYTSVMSLALAVLWVYASSAIIFLGALRVTREVNPELINTRFHQGTAFRRRMLSSK